MRYKLSEPEIREMAKRMRLKALDMAVRSGNKGAHLGPAFSCMEIMAVLYGNILNLDAENPREISRNRFISSKAHSVLAQYTALQEVGYISEEELDTFQGNATLFGGHPVLNLDHGMEYTGGSLGMALSVGVGMALDAKRKKKGHKVYILLGDGELNEGSNWEAVMSAAHFKLDNLVIIVDRNNLQYDGFTSDVMSLGDIRKKFEAFNCVVTEVNGHDVQALLEAFQKEIVDYPHAIIANTVKGKGVSFMENVREWHHSALSQKQYEQAVQEVRSM